MGDKRLGAIPSPADPRDWQLPLDMALVLPPKYQTKMPPTLNQGSTPQCVAYSSTSVRQFQQQPESGIYQPFDPNWLYARAQAIDGIPLPHDGTTVRAALTVLKNQGIPLKGKPATAPRYKIAAYYAIPMDIASLKAAIFQYGPINVASEWAESWMRPVTVGGAFVLPKFDRSGGGHATVLYGWDNTVQGGAFYLRNSWGVTWAANGSVYAPYTDFVPRMHDAWKSVDAKLGA